MRRNLDRVDLAVLDVVRSNVGPRLAIITREIDQSIVATGPDRALFVFRFDHVVDRAVDLTTCTFIRDRCTTVSLLVIFVTRQVRTDLLPRHAAILGAHEMV